MNARSSVIVFRDVVSEKLERREDMVAILPSPVVEIREMKTVAHRIVLEQGHQSRRFAIGQRLYQRRVYKRINRRCGSNSQREDDSRGQRKSRCPAWPPRAVAQILQQVSEPLGAVCILGSHRYYRQCRREMGLCITAFFRTTLAATSGHRATRARCVSFSLRCGRQRYTVCAE